MSEQNIPPSPAVDLLTALTRGSEDAAVAVLSPDVVVTIPQLQQRIEGSASVVAAWERARALFPDLEYRPHTRHVGSELVVDDATLVGTQTGGEQPTGRQLNAAVHVGVVHDGTTVREITADIDLQPLLLALGKSVDAYALAVSEVQALRGVDREGMVTYRLEEPGSNERAGTAGAGAARKAGRRRRADAKVLVAVVLMVLAAGGGRWFLSQREEAPAAAAVEQQHPAAKSSPDAPAPPADGPSPAAKPGTNTPPPAKKPAVVLKSDLAFGFDSSRVSSAARSAVVRIAGQARAAGLAGTILVEGYTDNLGSAAYGRQLSQRRADAVARILRGHLKGTPLRVVSVGRGESHPIRSNATAKGRASNRRVTIKLPSP